MKALTLINPVRRGRRGRFVKSSRRRRTRRTRIHRNPVRSRRRRKAVSRSRHHSPAMRAKISRAVKASMRRRRGGSSAPRRRARRTTMAVATRSFGRGSHHSPAMRAKISRAVRAANSRRRGGGGSVSRSRRRFAARRSNGGAVRGVGTFNLKSILSRPNLELAGGAIGAGFLTTFIVGKFGTMLPGITNTWVRMGYKLAIPVAGAFVVKRFSRTLAQGMVLGGIITVLNDLIASFLVPSAPAATSAYLNATPPKAFGAYLGAPQAQRRFSPSYNAVNSFGAATPYTGGSAFAPSAW